jgi:hypothetical protein
MFYDLLMTCMLKHFFNLYVETHVYVDRGE